MSEINQKIPIYIIANSVVSSEKLSSGGDRIFIEISKRLGSNWNLTIVTPEIGSKLCIKHGINAKYLLIPCTYSWDNSHSGSLGLAKVFIKRIIKAYTTVSSIRGRAIIHSSSDLLSDTIPALMIKLKNRSCKWIAGLYLVAPEPWKGYKKGYTGGISLPSLGGILYYFSQKSSILLMRKYADSILVLNNLDKNALVKQHFNPDKILVISGGVDLQEFNNVQDQEKKYDASFVGRFHEQKGIGDLIKIWKQVTSIRRDAKLVIIGSGDQKIEKEIRRQIITEGLQHNIVLPGFLDGDEKIKALKSSRIFIFPSTYESWGLVACEAMACGLPVVAYDLPIFADIFKGGMLRAPIGDFERLADYVLCLLNNQQLYETVSSEALQVASRFDWVKVAKEQIKIFESVYFSQEN